MKVSYFGLALIVLFALSALTLAFSKDPGVRVSHLPAAQPQSTPAPRGGAARWGERPAFVEAMRDGVEGIGPPIAVDFRRQ